MRSVNMFSQQNTSSVALKTLGNQKGLTLFEILIVVGIIGGLMAVLVPQIQRSNNRSKVGGTKIKMANVVQNLTMYQSDCQKYPSTLDALIKSDGNCNGWTGPYMKDLPRDDWGQGFQYESDGNNYTLKSLGADKRDGGDGVDRDITQDEIN